MAPFVLPQVRVVEEDVATMRKLAESGMKPDNLAASVLASLNVGTNDYEHFDLFEVEAEEDMPTFNRVGPGPLQG